MNESEMICWRRAEATEGERLWAPYPARDRRAVIERAAAFWGTTRARSTWLQRSTHESSVSFAGAMYRVFGIPTDRATTSSTISLRVTDVTLTMSPIASMDLYV